MIAFACGGCGKSFVVGDDRVGQRTRCRGCGAPIVVPAAAPADPSRAPRRVGGKPAKRRSKAWWSVDRETWVALGIGAVLAAVALVVPPIEFMLGVLLTVIHELGHTATAWVLGSPAFPRFDLTYGGGLSTRFDRQPILVAVGCGWFALALWRAPNDRRELVPWAIGAAVWGVAVFTPLRDPLIVAMGHGSELLFAGIFLYRALSGNQVLRSEERPLYAALGLFILAFDARFAISLITSDAHREAYGAAKGGGDWMDFSRIAADFGWSLPSVARLFLVACALTPVLSVLAYRRGRK